LVFLLEWLESGVMQRSEDVERYLEIPVIGTIPQQ
jgi:capsular polysaccharide biosynthesis protein